jgi:hypothetical protein
MIWLTHEIYHLYEICKYCVFNGASMFYGLIIFLVSIYASRKGVPVAELTKQHKVPLPPIFGRELPFPDINRSTRVFAWVLELASFSSFVRLIHSSLRFIRTVFLMRDHPSALRSFWRYFNIYYLIVVLPAAFMPPVLDHQRPPDWHLLAAVVLMICANALGDLVSVRLVLQIFKKAEPLENGAETKTYLGAVKSEAKYYLLVILAGLSSLSVLIVLLMSLSILYGVQVGQLDFALSTDFLRGAWERIIRFPEIASKPYWFRGQQGPFGSAGIPGLFLYGLTTFLPVLILTFLAAVWLLLLPFRLAISLPPTISPFARVIAAEGAVFGICVAISFALRRLEIL